MENAWVGNYYLKSGGYMAKSEWIYDGNYGSYYYLTSEGSYARNAWSGSYYLKSMVRWLRTSGFMTMITKLITI